MRGSTTFRLLLAASLLPMAVIAGCGDDGEVTMATSCAASASLRCAAARRGLAVGSAVNLPALRSDPTYGEVLGREFNIVTPENEMKWGPIHPERDRYDFAAADAIVQFARQHGMQVRGHNLAWHQQNPAWLVDGNFGREESIAILREHIRTVVGHYRGQIAEWDVVNEAFDDTNGTRRNTLWQQRIGADYIELAFAFAHEADPGAKLFYNDYATELADSKFRAVLGLAADLKSRGVPIDGVGFQAHALLGTSIPLWFRGLQSNLRQIADLGLDVAITELDVPIAQPAAVDALTIQASLYDSAIAACLAVPRCHTFVMWGFTDRHSWIPSTYPGLDDALPFDRNYLPKPAYEALSQRLNEP